MRTLALLAALSLAACSQPPAAEPPKPAAAKAPEPPSGEARAEAAGRSLIGKHAPAAVLTTLDGRTLDLAEVYGKKPVYLKFWGTWCATCLEQVPHLKAAHAAAGDDLQVVAVNVGFNETPEAVRRYRERHGLAMPVVIDDGRLAAAMNLRVTPQHIVVGRDGRILHVGHLADARLDRALADARAAAPAAAAAGPRAEAPAPLKAGEAAPAVSLAGADGEPWTLADPKRARPTVLVFLSPWCEGYLKTSRPEMSAACATARQDVEALSAKHPEVRWLGVAAGLWAAPQDLAEYRAEKKVTIPLALDADGAVFRRFGVTAAPGFARLDADGRLEARADRIDTAFVTGRAGR